MGALKKRNPLTESFLVQLDVDLEVLGTRIPKLRAAFPRNTETNTVSLIRSREATVTRMLTFMPSLKRMFVPPQPEGGRSGHGMMAATPQECGLLAEDHTENNINRSTPSKTPDTLEIDPALTSAAQHPIPSFSSLSGRWPNESSMTILEGLRRQSQQGGNTRFFGSSLMQDLINPDDMSLSPDAGQSSDRPTPNSTTTSASDRQQGGGGGNLTTGGSSSRSGHNSFETSPASSSAHGQRENSQQQQNSASRTAQSMFREFQGGTCGLPRMSSGDGHFAVPETPKNATEGGEPGAAVSEEFSWDSFAAGGTGMTSGMTPMSEGVLRTMLQMGPMETMDLGWDNPS